MPGQHVVVSDSVPVWSDVCSPTLSCVQGYEFTGRFTLGLLDLRQACLAQLCAHAVASEQVDYAIYRVARKRRRRAASRYSAPQDQRKADASRAQRHESLGQSMLPSQEHRQPPRLCPPDIKAAEPSVRVEQGKAIQAFYYRLSQGSLPPISRWIPARQRSRKVFLCRVRWSMFAGCLELKLKDFWRRGPRLRKFQPGPVITRFEIQPGPGVKVRQDFQTWRRHLAACTFAGRDSAFRGVESDPR